MSDDTEDIIGSYRWAIVGRIADLLSIAAVLTGVAGVVVAAFGFSRVPSNGVLVPVAIGFGLIGLTSFTSAIARNLSDFAAFDSDRGEFSRTLFAVGLASSMICLLALAEVVFHLLPAVTCNCR